MVYILDIHSYTPMKFESSTLKTKRWNSNLRANPKHTVRSGTIFPGQKFKVSFQFNSMTANRDLNKGSHNRHVGLIFHEIEAL